MALKTKLQAMRKRAGYKSAREFADHAGINVNTYTNYEQGKANMSLVQAWELADLLDCTIDELAGRRVPEKPSMSASEQRVLDVYRASDIRGRENIESAIEREARYMDESALKEKRDA